MSFFIAKDYRDRAQKGSVSLKFFHKLLSLWKNFNYVPVRDCFFVLLAFKMVLYTRELTFLSFQNEVFLTATGVLAGTKVFVYKVNFCVTLVIKTVIYN
jgi:hypothetical protein